MIAPIQLPETSRSARGIHRARRLIAAALLPAEADTADLGPPVGNRQAWLFTVWVVAVSAAWVTRMLGLW